MKNTSWAVLKPITDAESCRKLIKEVCYGFYFLAALQAGIGLLIMPDLILDAAVITILAVFVHTLKSRIAAVLLCLLLLLMFLSTLMNALGVHKMGGTNLVLAIITALYGIRAVEATFQYHRKYKNAEQAARSTL